MPDLSLILLVTVSFALAGFVKGVVGLGLPTISMGLLSLALAPAQSAALLIVPSLVTNVWQLWAGPDFRALIVRLWPMMLMVCVGVALGGGWLAGDNALAARVALGLCVAAYAALSLTSFRFHVPPHLEKWLGPPVGLATGLVTAATGIFVLPAVPYIQSLGLAKEDLIQALGLSFLVATVALAFGLANDGVFEAPNLIGSVYALAPALGGMWLGTALRHRLPAEGFRRWFLIGLLALGLYLAFRGLV
ncbi:MAG: sulfite exporter TauE/SafE family protein [Rhodospirillales bacterium]|nr:sulfite exporter TauE/SafE family protein [Rhodospirillales bacterium]